MVRLWQLPVESFLQGKLAALPLATLCQLPGDKPTTEALRDIVHEIDRRVGEEADHAEATQIMTATLTLAGLRIEKEDRPFIFKGEQMATIYDEAVEARRRAYVRVLLIQGTDRFGAPDAATESKLNAIEEYDRLELMCRSIYKVNSWQELLAIDY